MVILGLILLVVGGYVVLGLLLLPLHLTFESVIRLVTIPGELMRIALNPRLRANHALEHATINVIEEHVGPTTVTGMSREDGFLIRGVASGRLVEEAALTGLARLRAGDRRLAVHRRCGTSAAAGSFLLSLVFFAVILNLGAFSLPGVVVALLGAHFVGPVLGRLVQTYLTTKIPGPTSRIVGVYPVTGPVRSPLGWLFRPPPEAFFIRTSIAGR